MGAKTKSNYLMIGGSRCGNGEIMDNALVSAIITTHNRPAEIVLRAVQSVLDQTYSNIEIIVVDDSSSTFPQRNVVEKSIKGLSDKIIYISHIESKGSCAARNTGLAQAKGFYVAFLDDDDEWISNKIEEQLKGFSDSNIALVYCGFTVVDEIKHQRSIQNMVFRRGNIFQDLLKNCFVGNTSNPLIQRRCIDAVGGFDISLQSSQDYDLWLRIAKEYQVNFVDQPLLNYYIHNYERITTDLDKQIVGREQINHKYSKYIQRNRETWYIRHRELVPLYVEKGWREKAFFLWAECVKHSPESIIKNTKQMFLIAFGYNSWFMKYAILMNEKSHEMLNFLKRR